MYSVHKEVGVFGMATRSKGPVIARTRLNHKCSGRGGEGREEAGGMDGGGDGVLEGKGSC